MGIYDETLRTINRTSARNSIIYGGKAVIDATQMNQSPNTIVKPTLETPIITPAIVEPNTRVFDDASRNILEEAAGARRVSSELGRPEMTSSIFAQTMKGLSQITSQKSNYLSEVGNVNAASEAEARTNQSIANADSANKATLLQLDLQSKENALTDNANSIAANSFATSLGQLATIGAQKDQAIMDLLYLDKFMADADQNLAVAAPNTVPGTTQQKAATNPSGAIEITPSSAPIITPNIPKSIMDSSEFDLGGDDIFSRGYQKSFTARNRTGDSDVEYQKYVKSRTPNKSGYENGKSLLTYEQWKIKNKR